MTKNHKVLQYNEIKDHALYSEEYEVVFLYQKFNDEWVERTECFYSPNRNEHRKVQKRWEKEHVGETVRLIEVIHQ